MLAGHDEGEGELEVGGEVEANHKFSMITTSSLHVLVQERNGKRYTLFYGMSSDRAMEKHHGGVAKYRASEGKVVRMPYKGGVENTILDILGGIRSTCTYVGAMRLKELSKRTTFVRVAEQANPVYNTFE